ncbi:hypothetical protein RB595_009504 [Gaeumannomyces hyphopodioides]
MRLINTTTLDLFDVVGDNVKSYAILSHTWGEEEVTYEDMRILSRHKSRNKPSSAQIVKEIELRAGYQKIQRAAALARGDKHKYIWIDTCCIDKASSAELSEAINSMFSWYRDADVCYAYLVDVPGAPLAQSRWFTRGWTLQELIAPFETIFFSGEWQRIGTKRCLSFCDQLAAITSIDRQVLLGSVQPADVSVANRMRWAARRKTRRREDVAYCLMGIFGVNMPLLYGEGDRAFIRLQEEILKVSDDMSIFVWEQDDGAPGAGPEDQALYSHNRLSGLLASSPKAFATVDAIHRLPRPPTLKSMPCTMTNQGLHLSMYLRPMPPEPGGHSDSGLYIAFLDCYVLQGGEYVYPTLVLRNLHSDQFARSGVAKPLNRRDPWSESDQPSGHGYRDFYVRQELRHFMPDVLIDPNKAYRVADVFPPQCWYSDSHVISSKNWYERQGCFAVVRFAFANDDPQVDVAIGFRKHRGKWKAWCSGCFQVSRSLSLVYQEFSRLNKRPDSAVADRPTQGWNATVWETTIHGRPFIRFELAIHSELSGSGITLEQRTSQKGQKRSEQERTLAGLLERCWVLDCVELSIWPTRAVLGKIRTRDPKHGKDYRDFPPRMVRRSRALWTLGKAQLAAVLSDVDLLRASWDWQTNEAGEYPVIPKTLESPLHLAAAYGGSDHVEEMFDVLLGEGSGLTTRNAAGETPLHRACAAGNLWAVRRIMRSGQIEALLQAQDNLDRSPLWHAACAGQWEVILLLLRRPPDGLVDFADSKGRTPLHAACREGHSETARVLLDAGADPAAAAGAACFTPAHMAALMGHAACLEVLWEHPRVSKSHMDCTLQNIGSNDVGLGFDVYCTPLHLAVVNGHQDCVEVLLQAVANPISSCTHFITVSHEQKDHADTREATAAIEVKDAGGRDGLAVAIFEPPPGPTGNLWRAAVEKELERGRRAIETRNFLGYMEETARPSGLSGLARLAARLAAPLAAFSTRAGNARDKSPVKLLEPPPPPRERTPDSAPSTSSTSSTWGSALSKPSEPEPGPGPLDLESSYVAKWSAKWSGLTTSAWREEEGWEQLAYSSDR